MGSHIRAVWPPPTGRPPPAPGTALPTRSTKPGATPVSQTYSTHSLIPGQQPGMLDKGRGQAQVLPHPRSVAVAHRQAPTHPRHGTPRLPHNLFAAEVYMRHHIAWVHQTATRL